MDRLPSVITSWCLFAVLFFTAQTAFSEAEPSVVFCIPAAFVGANTLLHFVDRLQVGRVSTCVSGSFDDRGSLMIFVVLEICC